MVSVREQLRSGEIPIQQRDAAFEWLGRQEARAKQKAKLRANVTIAVSSILSCGDGWTDRQRIRLYRQIALKAAAPYKRVQRR